MKDFFQKHKSSLIAGGIFLVLSTLFVLIFSFSTSPLYPDYYGGDSAQFLTIGQNWAEGRIPYRDLFDHKGPVIFFVDALGFLLGGKSMICIIQIICLTVSLLFLYQTLKLITDNKIYLVLGMLACIILLTRCYEDGNHVQEYCLPFLTATTYFITRFFYNKQTQHNYKLALLYGVTVGVCLMTQATNAVAVGAGILAIMFLLIKNKEFKNLWQNLLAGLIGIAIIFIPFAVYFAANNAFGDFIFATFIYNAEYAGRVGTWLSNTTPEYLISFSFTYLGYWCLIPTIILAFYRKKCSYAISLIIAFVLETYLFFSTQSYPHYAIIVLPQIALFLNEAFLLKHQHRLQYIVKISIVLVLSVVCIKQVQTYLEFAPTKSTIVTQTRSAGYESMIQPYLNDMQKTSALAVGGNPMKDFYLKYDLPVYDKFFAIQGWHAKYDPAMREKIENQFRTTNTKYILIDQFDDFKNIIRERYELIDSQNDFELFCLR